ncbi:MAG: RNA polymerase sigma factor [Planctomycetota bacterium]
MIQSISVQEFSSVTKARFGVPYSDTKTNAVRSGVQRQATRPAVISKASASGIVPAVTERDAVQTEEARLLAIDVRKAQGGDAAAMTRLIEGNRTWVRAIAYSVLSDAHLAEDAAQEVCVRVVKHVAGLESAEAFRPWIYRMTRNVALSMAQRRERAPQPMALDSEAMREGGRITVDSNSSTELDEGEKVGTILEAIDKLPDIYREVLVLKHVQELSYAEMSSVLGVSVKSLEVRLVRARKMLQEKLGRRFDRGRKRDPRDDKASA